MGIVGVAGAALNAHAVGVAVPFVAVAGNDVVGLNDDLGGVGHILIQSGITDGLPDLSHGVLADEQGGHPLGGAGLDQGHGQLVPGSGGGAVEYQIHHQHQGCHGENDHRKQHKEESADDPAQQAAALLLFLFGWFGSPAPLRRNGIIIGHCVSFAHFFSTSGSFCFWGAKTQRC